MPEPAIGPQFDSDPIAEAAARVGVEAWRQLQAETQPEPFITYEMEDGSLIWGEYQFTTELDGFEDDDEEVRLIKRTYRLVSEEIVVLNADDFEDEVDLR